MLPRILELALKYKKALRFLVVFCHCPHLRPLMVLNLLDKCHLSNIISKQIFLADPRQMRQPVNVDEILAKMCDQTLCILENKSNFQTSVSTHFIRRELIRMPLEF